MKKITRFLSDIIEKLCLFMLVIQIIAVSIVVIGRQVFSSTPAWGEELTLFCLVWVSFLGSVILLNEDGHIAVTAFDAFLSARILRFLDLISSACLLFFAVMMLRYGIKLIEVTSCNTMSALKIKSSWLYAGVPVSSLLMILVLIRKFLQKLLNRDTE